MKADIIKIGNSKGIRIPASILKQCGIETKVEIEVQYNKIILKPIKTPREGWAASFHTMASQNDDQILILDELDTELLGEWNDD